MSDEYSASETESEAQKVFGVANISKLTHTFVSESVRQIATAKPLMTKQAEALRADVKKKYKAIFEKPRGSKAVDPIIPFEIQLQAHTVPKRQRNFHLVGERAAALEVKVQEMIDR
eukprot:NODE_1563_length_523_cov_67.067511_g1486_i0.p1 GENE.NODE_1563_length_523_cov_67.067511_g1486_i0~~NODE_1563_length_523_cov_67.067511_g1486_i0.p1  ORF type:complete len:127 (+),score=41.90 NODE_1563_length_523_cov_67.067511_g1486_i0:36-383(+)